MSFVITGLRARAEITLHFGCPAKRDWRGASDEQYPRRYVRSEQQSQRACPASGKGARPELRSGSSTMYTDIACVPAPRICPPGARAKM